MATEIVTLKVKDDFTPAACEKSLAYLKDPAPAGLQIVRWGYTIEGPKIVILLNWDSVEDHEAFIRAPIYPEFLDTIKSFCTAPVTFYHTYLKPFPPTKVFEAGIIEISSFYKKAEVSDEQVVTARDRLLDLARKSPGYHSHFSGTMHEDPNVYVLVLGWDAVEAHTAFRSANVEDLHKFGALLVNEKSSTCHVKLHLQ